MAESRSMHRKVQFTAQPIHGAMLLFMTEGLFIQNELRKRMNFGFAE